MPQDKLLVIVGYGGGPGDNHELNDLVDALSTQLNVTVRAAFLESSAPSLGEAIQDGIADVQPAQVIVLPLYVGASPAQQNAVQMILDAAADRWPEIVVHAADELGAHPGVIAAYREMSAAVTFKADSSGDTALLVVGRGGRDAHSNADVYSVARLLWENSGLGSVEVAFYSKTQPDIAAGIKRGLQSGARRIIVLPYTLYDHHLDNAILDRVRQVEALFPDVDIITAPHLSLQPGMIDAITERYQEALASLSSGTRRVPQPHSHGGISHTHGIVRSANEAQVMLPPRYQGDVTVSAAPMGAADLVYDAAGQVAWDQIWGSYCDLALAGGPPHRGTLLEPVMPHMTGEEQERYRKVLAELERGIRMVTGLLVIASAVPGWIGVQCADETMALWLLRAIIVENVSVRREGAVLYLPAGPDFRLEHEIKNVITVVAKTHHYWTEHRNDPDSNP